MDNYLPSSSGREDDTGTTRAFRELGVIAMLEIDYWKGQSESSIKEFYEDMFSNKMNNTIIVNYNKLGQPAGYATWVTPSDDKQNIILTRQCAPFGDHLDLQRKIQKKHPNTGTKSIHQRSSRREQIAW